MSDAENRLRAKVAAGPTATADQHIDFQGSKRERRDEFGFVMSDADAAELQRGMKQRVEMAQKWDRLLQTKVSRTDGAGRLKGPIRHGIVGSARPLVWLTVSGAKSRKDYQTTLYARMLDDWRAKPSKMADQIEKDLHRTFPENEHFYSKEGVPEKARIGQLRNVLNAFAMYNTEIGYCQGMNYIAGLLLLVMDSEEDAFWLLVVATEYLLQGYYNDALVQVRVEQQVLSHLLHDHFPRIHAHLAASSMPELSIVTIKWFITLYIDVLPLQTTLRVWDAFFNEGAKVLFRVALALFAQHQEAILAITDAAELFDFIRKMPATVRNADALLHSAFAVSLSSKTIEKYRALARTELNLSP